MNYLKNLLLWLKFGPKSNSKSFVKYLKNKGIKIGNNCEFNSPWTTIVDYSKPWLLQIGNNVVFSSKITILTHDGSWRVLHNLYGDVLGSTGKVIIGNNVFVGMGSTILKNVTIGDNVIIGAESLVTRDLDSNFVYAGSPAKKIMSIEDFYNKRQNLQKSELLNNLNLYILANKKKPSEVLFKEYFFQFIDRNQDLNKYYKEYLQYGDNYLLSLNRFKETKNSYSSFNGLLNEVMRDE
ncbi:MAG: acyltransferase [Clostridia bacterium]|nr:acyltransferase [Clostridia bacterium]